MADQTTNNAALSFLNSLNDALDIQNGICFMEAKPVESGTVRGKSVKEGDGIYCYPTAEMGRRALTGSPLALWFVKDEKERKIRMNIEMMTKATVSGAKPYPLVNVKLSLCVLDDNGNKIISSASSSSSSSSSPQKISGSAYYTLPEFSFVKERIKKGFDSGNPQLFIQWSGDLVWVPMADYSKYTEEQDANKKKAMWSTFHVSGELPVNVDYTNEYLYHGVKGLLNWEEVWIGSGNYNIWFKDTLETNSYYFLPQMFRIKANPITNAPKMSFSLVRDPEANSSDYHSYKVRMSFEMVPYYHPRAERDLYREMNKRTSGHVKMCNMMYGGYESATFTPRKEESINALFHQLGVKLLQEGEIQTAPDSSFTISLESSLDAFNAIRDAIMGGAGIHIGDVIVEVKDGLDDTIRKIPLQAELDLMKVAGTNIGINILESSNKKYRFPHSVELTNNGKYTIEIGGCELSMLSEKKGNERDSVHELKTDETWPITLAPGQKTVIVLQTSDLETLNKKNKFLGLNIRKYWTTLICQPYSVHLRKEDLNAIIEDIEDHASSDIKIWELEVAMRFDWSSLPDVEAIEVEVKNEEYAKDEIVKMNKGTESTKVNMSGNLTAIRQAQLIFNQNYQYRLRAVMKDRVTAWSEYQDGSGITLYLFSKAISPLLNANNN